MNKIKLLLIPLAIFLFSFFLRLSLISKGPYDVDCLDLALRAEETLSTHRLSYLHGAGYPLTVILGAIFVSVAKFFHTYNAVIAVNFMSVTFGSLCVLVQYQLTKKLLDETAAIFSSLMLSISPIFLGVSLYGTSQVPFLFFLLLGVSFLLTYLKTGLKRHLIASAISLGLMTATREQDMTLIFWAISYLIFVGVETKKSAVIPLSKKKRLILFLIFWFITLLVTLPFHIPLLMDKEIRAPYLHEFYLEIKEGSWGNFMGILSPKLPKAFGYLIESLTIGGFIFSLLGFIVLGKKKYKISVFLILWIIVPLFFYGNLYTNVSARYFLMILPPFIIAQACILSQLVKSKHLLKFLTLVSFLIIFFILYSRFYSIFKFRHDHALLPEFAQWVAKNTEPHAKIITADERIFIEYYGHRSTVGRPTWLFITPPQEIEKFKGNIDEIIASNIPVYITASSLYAYDYHFHFSDFVKKNYRLDLVGKHGYEEWHAGVITPQIFYCSLYKITKK